MTSLIVLLLRSPELAFDAQLQGLDGVWSEERPFGAKLRLRFADLFGPEVFVRDALALHDLGLVLPGRARAVTQWVARLIVDVELLAFRALERIAALNVGHRTPLGTPRGSPQRSHGSHRGGVWTTGSCWLRWRLLSDRSDSRRRSARTTGRSHTKSS